jgi:hypothetical protein
VKIEIQRAMIIDDRWAFTHTQQRSRWNSLGERENVS